MSTYSPGYATTGGRSGSQSSVYDYPEHLNPFYEDENHKRLRFWHFGGHRSDKPKSERRGSLVSIRDGLRDMWEFKTFRVKKKRSSSLGVTKTSESPPPLRRDDAEAHYNTISNASAYRATISHTQSNTTTPMFQRNTRYRSSLQDQQRDANGIGLFRNDRYRSTIQNGFATYGGGGHNTMVTSTPRSRYNAATTGRGMTAGVSQTSLKSTNPFDDDDTLDDSVSLGGISANGTIRQSMTRTRKKRRAPPPPPRMVNTSTDSTSDASQLATRLRIDETPPPVEEDPKDVQELTNLTAEIESFVRTTSNDNVASASNEVQPATLEATSSSDANNNRVTNLVIVEEKDEVVTTESATNEGATKLEVRIDTTSKQIPEPVEEISQVEELKIIEEPPPPLPSPRSKPTPPPVPQTPPVVEEVDLENLALPETPVPARRHNKNRNQPVRQNGDVLRITESSDSVTTPEEEQNMDSKAIKPVNYEFEYKVEPIKTEIDAKIGSARLKISESTSDVNVPPNDGTERRRSVRDIIESINKSQSLLKVNHDSTGTLYSAQSSDSVHRNMRELNEREREIHRLLREMGSNLDEPVEPATNAPIPPTKKRGSYYDNVPESDENMDNLLSKSDLRIKKSPTKSLGMDQNDEATFQDCIDWNPLPKPRRSRHFAEPAAVNQSSVMTAPVAERNGQSQS